MHGTALARSTYWLSGALALVTAAAAAATLGSILTYWVIESVGVAVDQWFGHAADPSSTVASLVMVPAFGLLALVGLIPLYVYFHHLHNID
jgi:membrane protein YdbS with pleckstrin-like domain